MIQNSRKQHLITLFIYCIISLILLYPASTGKVIPKPQDEKTHIAAIVQAREAMKEGQFPLRTAPIEYHGRGYPKFQFYGPSLYQLTSIIYSVIAPNNPCISFNIILFLSFLCGGFFIYRLVWQLTQRFSASLLSGFAYMVSPYFLVDAHWRHSLTETLALGILAAVLYYTFQLFFNEKFSIKHWLLSSFWWYLLITVHIVTFVNFSLFIGLLILLSLHNKKTLIHAFYVGTAYIWACLLAAWFMAPAFLDSSLIRIGRQLTDTLLDSTHLTSLPRLLSFSWTAASEASPYSIAAFYPAIGWPFLIAFLLCFIGVCFGKMKKNTFMVIKLLLLFILAFFITWSPFDFWPYLPKVFTISQYTYRLLAQIIWIGSLLLGFALSMILKEKVSSWFAIPVGIILIGFCSFSWLEIPPQKMMSVQLLMQDPHLGYFGEERNYLISVNTKEIPHDMQIHPTISVKELESFCHRNHGNIQCDLPSSFTGGIAQFPVLYYPDLLAVFVDRQSSSYFPTFFDNGTFSKNASAPKQKSSYLLVGLSLSPGKHAIVFEFTGLTWANKVSLITIILSILIIIVTWRANIIRPHS